jgi:hypothetical protein
MKSLLEWLLSLTKASGQSRHQHESDDEDDDDDEEEDEWDTSLG